MSTLRKEVILCYVRPSPSFTFFWYKGKGVGLHVPQKLVSYKCLEFDSEHFAQGSDTVLC